MALPSPDFDTLRARMETIKTSFIDNFPPPVTQMAIDTSGNAAPSPGKDAPPAAPPKATPPPTPPKTQHTAQTNAPAHSAPPPAPPKAATSRKPYKPRNAQNFAPSAPQGGKIHNDIQAGRNAIAAQSADKPPTKTRTQTRGAAAKDTP